MIILLRRLVINLNLIPFGLSEKDGKLLDVANVVQGKRCGCICPSCKSPLIARHGQIKEWHFAHTGKVTSSQTKNPCKYSLFVSVRLMARQILGENLELLLPEYHDTASVGLSSFPGQLHADFKITGQQRITLTQIEIDQSFLGKPVDIIGHIGEFSFIIYFTYPGRHIPGEFFNPSDSHCGILGISLNQIPALFLNAKKQNKSYLNILHRFLCINLPSKRWVFHPRYAQKKEEALNELRQKAEKIIEQKKKEHDEIIRRRQQAKLGYEKRHSVHKKSNQITQPYKISPVKKYRKSPPVKIENIEVPYEMPPKRQANFLCVLCETEWQGPDPSDSVCPKCKTHLYRKLVSYVDG